MVRKDTDNLRKGYENLFDDRAKIEAFDKIAENYYLGNFGSMQKADMDVLLFSIYIERILDKSEDDINSYSDYTLSKQLGISQSRISTLKVKKQLQYPYDKFEWETSFLRFCKNAKFDDGKIRINLRDKNLYYELKNELDESGSFVETTLTSNLLVISASDFYDLTMKLIDDQERRQLHAAIRKKYNNDSAFCEKYNQKPIGKVMTEKFGDKMFDIVCEIAKDVIPGAGSGIKIFEAIRTAIHNK